MYDIGATWVPHLHDRGWRMTGLTGHLPGDERPFPVPHFYGEEQGMYVLRRADKTSWPDRQTGRPNRRWTCRISQRTALGILVFISAASPRLLGMNHSRRRVSLGDRICP